ncbi:c-type cytochrome [Desulfuromonas versatilis]|uniref:nitrite reductase (cytochrome; ammonia-forming) n=1 Tax=Desulfuromonas versatilis TaxID=2802975 RepID=A0ABN6E3L9_9BACT|nr:c-type cytochrome [Desulfuromonas versatilis]
MQLIAILAVSGAMIVAICPSSPAISRPSGGVLQGAHGDKELLPGSCRACHRGMAMKISGEENVCLDCHGDTARRQEMERRGMLKNASRLELANIHTDLRKAYAHPVLTTSGVHRQRETLPEEQVNAARHAECVDCHQPHVLDIGKPFRGISGKRVGNFIADIDKEYELCYRCHSSSANLPASSTNKHAEFKATNPSFHPVEAEGRNKYVISLKSPYVAEAEKPGDVSMISCSDCHGSDDPDGPRGPHGSRYRGLLNVNYEMTDGRPESEYAYGLCYKCHDRSSILGNESFPYHALHIEGRSAANLEGTSCFTCHDAHGSSRYQYLIRFNEEVVKANSADKLEFKAQGVASRHGSCLLTCHGVEHNPKSY